MFWVSFPCKERDTLFLTDAWGMDLSLSRGFPQWPQTLCSLSQGQNPNQRPWHLHSDWGTKHAQYAPHLPPTTPRGGHHASQLRLLKHSSVVKTTMTKVVEHHNKSRGKLYQISQKTKDMPSKNTDLNELSLTWLCLSQCQTNHCRLI